MLLAPSMIVQVKHSGLDYLYYMFNKPRENQFTIYRNYIIYSIICHILEDWKG